MRLSDILKIPKIIIDQLAKQPGRAVTATLVAAATIMADSYYEANIIGNCLNPPEICTGFWAMKTCTPIPIPTACTPLALALGTTTAVLLAARRFCASRKTQPQSSPSLALPPAPVPADPQAQLKKDITSIISQLKNEKFGAAAQGWYPGELKRQFPLILLLNHVKNSSDFTSFCSTYLKKYPKDLEALYNNIKPKSLNRLNTVIRTDPSIIALEKIAQEHFAFDAEILNPLIDEALCS